MSGWEEYSDLFRRLGLDRDAKAFWQAARSGNSQKAMQILKKIEDVLSRTKNLRAAAGTLGRMRAALQAATTVAEVTPVAAEGAVVLSEEAALLLGEDAALVAAGGTLIEAESPLVATGPPGWLVIAGTLLILLLLAAAAHGEERPEKPEKNPFRDLPPDPRINPVTKLNQGVPKKLKEYQDKLKKKCRCFGVPRLGGAIAGRQLAMGGMPPRANLCTWPKCPSKQA